MATRGGQPGNRNAAKAREWADAIRWALAHHEDDTIKRGQALRRIAARVVEKALEGDLQSIAEIGNRLDAKPAQAVELGNPDGTPINFTLFVPPKKE